MNREIKFRAWDIALKQMIENPEECYWFGEELCASNNQTPSYIFMQYTGLEDKNGKEIYEGDIVKMQFVFGKREPVIGKIKFECGMFLLGSNSLVDGYIPLYELSDSECYLEQVGIIGNVFENPNLLEEK